MVKSSIFYSDLLKEGTMSEVVLYGLIESLSFNEGYCWANSETMAERIGVTKGTLKNLLSSIHKKGWVEINSVGNKRLSIKPLLQLSKPKKQHKKPVEKSVEKSKAASSQNDARVILELRKSHSRMTQGTGVTTGVGDKIEYKYKKEINKEKTEKSQSGLADLKASQPALSPYKMRLRKMIESYNVDQEPEPDREAFVALRQELSRKGIIKH